MPSEVKKIAPKQALYIKLGKGGYWEEECLDKRILRFDYKETPFDAATSGDWDTVHAFWLKKRGDAGTATRDLNQIRYFFEVGPETLWITFSRGLLRWCFAKGPVKKHRDGGGSYRETIDGWYSTNLRNEELVNETLSGNLLKVRGFQGTICRVNDLDYLTRKINGDHLPVVNAAIKAKDQMVEAIVPLMRELTWQDFELLVDLIFANSGWRRVGQVGKTEKAVDVELLLPTTGERASIQIKSKATRDDLEEYRSGLATTTIYSHMFFVWHRGNVGQLKDDKITLINPARLAQMVLDSGLTSWLLRKVS